MAITQRGKNTWRITISAPKSNKNVQYPRITETFHGLKSEAKIRESELKKKVKAGGIFIDKRITFEEFSNIWIEKHVQTLAPKTCCENKKLLKVINSYIGNLPLANITTIILTDFYNKLRERGKITKSKDFIPLSEKTINNYYELINRIFNKAIEWEYLERNPNQKVTKPKIIKHQAKFYTEEDVKRLLKCLENEPLKYQALIYLGIDLGAREGEITGLNWDDIDLENRTVSINKVTQYVDRKIIEKTPKNNSSIRQNIITPKTAEILKCYKKEQLEKELLLGNKWEKTKKVFTKENGGLMFPSTPYKVLKSVQETYNLPSITFHQLRHTMVSLLVNAGVSLPIVGKIVGHSDATTTSRIYAHIESTAEINAKKKMENILN